MGAVWMRLRAELRSRLPAILSLAVIIGVMGGVVIASAAGARRTQSAYPRFVRSQHAMDLVVRPYGKQREEALRAIEQAPRVVDFSLVEVAEQAVRTEEGRVLNFPAVFPFASPDGRFGTTVNALKILSGRAADPTRADEVVASFTLADRLDLRPGDTIQLGLFGSTGPFGAPLPPASERPLPIPLTVVGVGAAPAEFAPLAGGYIPGLHLTPAFYRDHTARFQRPDAALAVVLRGGTADIPSFRRDLARISRRLDAGFEIPFTQPQQTAGVQRATGTQVVALWALAILVAIAALAVFSQSLARQSFLESTEHPILRALGLTPRQLLGVGLVRVAGVGLVGALVAVGVAFALSPLTPTGVARIAEPDPGLAVDPLVMPVGALALVLLVVGAGTIPAWRAARGSRLGTLALEPVPARPSVVAGSVVRLGARPSVAAGVRMALEPGRGRTAVPVRTTMLGTMLGLFALVVALSFGASLTHLSSEPRLIGWNWDALMGVGGQNEPPSRQLAERDAFEDRLSRDPRIGAFAVGSLPNLRVNGIRSVVTIAMESRKGSVGPSLAEGSLPVAPDQIALGTDLMREAGVDIGDTVTVRMRDTVSEMRVVGRVAVPDFFLSFSRPGDGAAVSLDWLRELNPGSGEDWAFFVRFAPGVDDREVLADLRASNPALFVFPRSNRSSTVASLNSIGDFPLVLAAVVALLAAATLGHTLVTSVRRRGRDLAVLKTIGFRRRQISATVAWQATTLAVVALAIGIPLGIVAGRWGWNLLADRLGVVPEPVFPLAAVLLVVPAALLMANLVAAIPGVLAARTQPARVLRSE